MTSLSRLVPATDSLRFPPFVLYCVNGDLQIREAMPCGVRSATESKFGKRSGAMRGGAAQHRL